MITIIHGEDTTASRQTFILLKQQSKNPLSFEGDKVTLTDLAQALSGDELFTTEKSIFIEHLLTKKKSSKEMDEMLSYLLTQADQSITLWEGKDVDKRTLTKFPKANIQQFKYPVVIFSFLDAIKPGNGASLVKQLRKVTETIEIEAVFFLLIRQIRLFLALRDAGQDDIEEVKRMAPWQRGKVEKQAKSFSKEHLVTLHKKLYELDLAQKTGTLPYPNTPIQSGLSSAIDIFLLTI